MRIAIVGTGYVGLVVGTGFAENGHWVTCIDRDEERIRSLQEGRMPIYEPGLEELLMRNVEEDRLNFTNDLAAGIADRLLIFLCVDTPAGPGGESNLEHLWKAAGDVAGTMTGYAILVVKSTVPVGTTEQLRDDLRTKTEHPFDVVANPEFLKEGNAVDDFLRPDRVVVGCDDVRVLEIMKELYAPFLRTGKPFLAMSLRSAEMAKYAVNAALAVRISMMNELANMAGACGADIGEVREAVMADSRLGAAYLFPGVGFGGSCMPKDVLAAARQARALGLPCPLLEGVTETNRCQQEGFVAQIAAHYPDGLAGKKIAVWGGSFKPRTDDIREAPALRIIDGLLEQGAEISVYDPVAGGNLRAHYGDKVTVARKLYETLDKADGLAICTEWREFHHPDFERMAELMRQQVVFDGRNLFSPKTMAKQGFAYYSIGRPATRQDATGSTQ